MNQICVYFWSPSQQIWHGGRTAAVTADRKTKLKNQLPNGNALKFLLSLYSKIQWNESNRSEQTYKNSFLLSGKISVGRSNIYWCEIMLPLHSFIHLSSSDDEENMNLITSGEAVGGNRSLYVIPYQLCPITTSYFQHDDSFFE